MIFFLRMIATFIFVLPTLKVWGQGINGTIRDEQGDPLPFATIYIKELQTGTTTNEEAYFELPLAPGFYTLVFQHLGYGSITRKVQVENVFQQVEVRLSPQAMVLKAINIRAGKEDPAYTIMRKAIAKAKYHVQQIDRYTATVYIKGKGRLIDAPFFLRRALRKEGIDSSRLFISESVNEVEYQRPNTYKDKVVSIRSSGDDNNTAPNAYIYGSFYEPELGETVSPLSPKAFSYYRFYYEGTFTDRGFAISKIRVVPRSKGDNVFQGFMHIVEDYWSIHSLHMQATKLGIDFDIEQIYAPIQEQAWLPVSHKFKVGGSILGFDFEYDYWASVSNYQIEINPDLEETFEVIDEKVDQELAASLEEKNDNVEAIQEQIAGGKEVTRKQLRQVIKEYEKLEQEQREDPDIISNYSLEVDSTAYKKDSSYWARIRPIPLSQKEVSSYVKTDSLAEISRQEREGDTLKVTKGGGFRPQDLIMGNTYSAGDKAWLAIDFVYPQFNTVEGLSLTYRFNYSKTFDNKNWIKVGPKFRYGFSGKRFLGTLQFAFAHGERFKRGTLKLEGGRYFNQYNHEAPIHPWINTFTTLFLNRNYMKLYERDFIDLSYRKFITRKLAFNFGISFSERRELFNSSDFTIVDRENIFFTPNAPLNSERASTSFPEHRAMIVQAGMSYEPWLKFRVRNGVKQRLPETTPKFTIHYKKGLEDVFGAIGFDQLEAGVRYRFKVGVRGKVDLALQAGTFLNSDSLAFMDYKHFTGNLTPFITTDPVKSFRLLDYYRYSTREEYFTGNLHYQFRKLLVTRLPYIRLLGIRENLLANYLYTVNSENYTELGYSIDYIFRVFRLEAIASFQDGSYKDFGVRVGIATNLENLFGSR